MTENKKGLTLLQVIGSVLAAIIGVQSEKNRQRDFESGSAKTYFIVGVIATILFILMVSQIVKWVLGA